jgi:hypothetical protein
MALLHITLFFRDISGLCYKLLRLALAGSLVAILGVTSLFAADRFAYVVGIRSGEGQGQLWVSEEGRSQVVPLSSLPLALPKDATVRLTQGAVAKIVLPKGRLDFSDEKAQSLDSLNDRLKTSSDPLYVALNKLSQDSGTRGGNGELAYPVELCAVLPDSLVVSLKSDWPAGPVELSLFDASGNEAARTVVTRKAGELVLTSEVLSRPLQSLQGARIKVVARSGEKRASVVFVVLPSAMATRLAQKLQDYEQENDPVFRHLLRARVYEEFFLLREALAEFSAARDAGAASAPRLTEMVSVFSKRYGL